MNYKGSGPLKNFVADCNNAMNALHNCKVTLPPLNEINNAKLSINGSGEDAKLVLDLSDVPIVSLNNVDWDVTVSFGGIKEQDIEVKSGKVVITLYLKGGLLEE